MDPALSKKLMLEKFSHILILDMPESVTEFNGLAYDTKAQGSYDLVIRFVFSLEEMEQTIQAAARDGLVRENGYLYLPYPKKGNKAYPTYIHRDDLIARFDLAEGDGYMGDSTLKFTKMVAFNDTFTLVGLRNLKKSAKAPTGPSYSVEDYVDQIPTLRQALAHRPEILARFDALAKGYQKDWARHVYSARQEETREKRLLETADLLEAGYKSKALSRQKH